MLVTRPNVNLRSHWGNQFLTGSPHRSTGEHVDDHHYQDRRRGEYE